MDILQTIQQNLPQGHGLGQQQLKLLVQAVKKAVGEYTVPNHEYRKKAQQLQEMWQKLEQMENTESENLPLLQQHKDLLAENEKLKQQMQELRAAQASLQGLQEKSDILRTKLLQEGANPSLVGLLQAGFNPDDILIDEEGNIKDWQQIIQPVKSAYAAIFGRQSTRGAHVASPPQVQQQGYALADIKKMSNQQINQNWENIQKTLAGGNT